MSKVVIALTVLFALNCLSIQAADGPETPRIESVVPLKKQPLASDKAVIWYDNFDTKKSAYAESKGGLTDKEAFGGVGKSLKVFYPKGKGGGGSADRKIVFGDSPVYSNKALRKGEKFEEVYWRVYVKHQYGWTGGGPAKLSRATSFHSSKWAQAMIAHVWSAGEKLTLDPVRCVKGSTVMSKKYNDWGGMVKWLGNSPPSKFKIHATEESGYWVLVEAHARLNTPGKSDGVHELWIDGRLEAERKNLNFRGSYTGHGINAVFLESYWNKGSPVDQTRWYDDWVISTKPIGPVACPANPELIKMPYHGAGKQAGWEVEMASDYDGKDVVFKSKMVKKGDRLKIEKKTGKFSGSLKGKSKLAAGKTYYTRVRQQNNKKSWSGWSRWHQGFVVVQ